MTLSDKTVATGRDPVVVGALTDLVRDTAYMICGEQPGVPQPHLVTDLDSFSSVQLMLELEKATEVNLLEDLGYFEGASFADMAEHVLGIAEQKGELPVLIQHLRRRTDERQSPDDTNTPHGEATSA
ncbi:hypothetical protein ADL21_00285 [Streptomyces albus subsp. albus]|nr:hypothetical protein ADL21_00285 [Streptomyces albus subsp. albus]